MKKMLCLSLLCLFALQIKAAGPYNGKSSLSADQYLLPGDYITNGSAYLVLQTDGNLCLRTSPTGGTGIWCNMFPGSGPRFLIQQGDGNLCVYNGTPSARGSGIWCSRNVSAPFGNYITQINSSNNAVCTYPAAGGNSIWCSNAASDILTTTAATTTTATTAQNCIETFGSASVELTEEGCRELCNGKGYPIGRKKYIYPWGKYYGATGIMGCECCK